MEQGMDVGVVGAGIVGLATARTLRDRGAAVTVYERGEPGAAQSGGESRIFRHGHDDPRMVTLARRGRAVWAEWEERFGVELVSRDGAVAIGPAVERRLPLLIDAVGIDARRVDAAELAERLPVLAPFDGPAFLDAAGGSIRTSAAIAALAGDLGDALVHDEVYGLRPVSGGVEVRAGGVRAVHDRVVVCAGAGTAGLARGLGLDLPVELAAHVRLTFAVRGAAPARLACLQDSSGDFGETGTYAAALPGNTRYGVGLSETVDLGPDGSVDPHALAELAGRARAYVARALPGLDPDPVGVRHCWVTELPWSSDGVAAWEADGTIVVAGHNLFKQAPALGIALADAAVGDGLPAELRPDARLGAPPDA